MRRHVLLAACLPLLATACNVNANAGSSFETEGTSSTSGEGTDGPGTSSAGTTGAGTDAGGATSDHGSSSGGSTGGTIFDLGAPDIPLPTGCQKVDILFAIDASGSMYVHQQALLDSYQGFVDGISAHFDDDRDFHIGVITTDYNDDNEVGCQDRGDLVTRTGFDGSNTTCSFVDGNRFMTHNDDLPTAFPCAANVGSATDDDERPVTASIEALGDMKNGAGGCNEGFLRDDALLVIVMISNAMEKSLNSDANANEDSTPWYPAIVDLKQGHPENAVAIGFIASGDTWCIPNGYDGLQAPPMIEFIQDFGPNGVLANVCQQDYSPIFTQAIDVVIDACEGFVPPG